MAGKMHMTGNFVANFGDMQTPRAVTAEFGMPDLRHRVRHCSFQRLSPDILCNAKAMRGRQKSYLFCHICTPCFRSHHIPNGTKLTTGLNSDVLLVLSEAVLLINEVVIVIEKSTAQIDYEHDYDYAHDSQNSASYLSGIPSYPPEQF
jgi:hypothetical protein